MRIEKDKEKKTMHTRCQKPLGIVDRLDCRAPGRSPYVPRSHLLDQSYDESMRVVGARRYELGAGITP
jgi:hypothetical protein